MPEMTIRRIDPSCCSEPKWVAQRMKQTLIEVLGEEEGGRMYTMEWLVERVRWHLDPAQRAEVFLAEAVDGDLVGHTIVRVETQDGEVFGLFSTTFVESGARRLGVANRLLDRGERWMRAEGMTRAVTYTDKGNHGLQALFIGRGYTMSALPRGFVKLARPLLGL